MSPCSIVSCRKRDWVLLPADNPDEIRLRPLTGATDEVVALHRKLVELAAMVTAQRTGTAFQSSLIPLLGS